MGSSVITGGMEQEGTMKEFALFVNKEFREIRTFEEQPPDAPHKGFTWLEVERREGPKAGAEIVTEGDRTLYVISRLSAEFIPPEVPESITRRQCALELLDRKVITPEEALAMTKAGDVPAAVAQVFGKMEPDARILAEIDFAAGNYYRSNSLLGMMGLTPAEVDQFFIAAAKR